MEQTWTNLDRTLEAIVKHLDIPKSLYEKARDRHRNLGEWLNRDESLLRQFDPDVRPQGSFRYGVVNRPLNPDDEYDLDNVCVLKKLSKRDLTQKKLKELYGAEINAYAQHHGMKSPAEEHNRCWRLCYADEVGFHLDTVPCVPEADLMIARIVATGVPEELARRAVAITDKRDQNYEIVSQLWPSSNPRGFAALFEQKAALGRVSTVKGRAMAAVEDVPPYEWKTTLQRSIQILKRHRDVKFRDTPELAPISMLITSLSAQSYSGEPSLAVALVNIVNKMPGLVRKKPPRVPNPANLGEDYADKWSRDSRLEPNFWAWHGALKSLLNQMLGQVGQELLVRTVDKSFDIGLTADDKRDVGIVVAPTRPTIKPAPIVIPSSAPKPWGDR